MHHATILTLRVNQRYQNPLAPGRDDIRPEYRANSLSGHSKNRYAATETQISKWRYTRWGRPSCLRSVCHGSGPERGRG
jgi:hypothetical protein